MANTQQKPQQLDQNGHATKPLYIKHFALTDWEALQTLKNSLNLPSVAETIRFAVNKAAGRL